MKDNFVLLVFVFFISQSLIAQSISNNLHLVSVPQASTTPNYDNEVSIIDVNGDKVVARTVAISPDFMNIMLIKSDVNNSNVTFSQLYDAEEHDLKVTNLLGLDDGYIMVGLYDQGHFLFASRLDLQGNVVWSKTYDYQPGVSGYVDATIVNNENSFIVTGSGIYASPVDDQVGSIFAAKIDFSGQQLWANTYKDMVPNPNFPDINLVTDIEYDPHNDGYVIVGNTLVFTYPPNSSCPYAGGFYHTIFAMGIDANGNVYSSYKRLDGESSFVDEAPVLLATNDGFILAYSAEKIWPVLQNGEKEGLGVMQLDENLSQLKTKIYNINNLNYLFPKDISEHPDTYGYYDIVGTPSDNKGSSWFLKIDSNFDPVTARTYNDGEQGYNPDMLMTNFGYYLVSNVANGIRIIDTDLYGSTHCSEGKSITDQYEKVIESNRNYYEINVMRSDFDLPMEYFPINYSEINCDVPPVGKITPTVNSTNLDDLNELRASKTSIFPTIIDNNTLNISSNIELETPSEVSIIVYNSIGQVIETKSISLETGSHQINFNGTLLSNGFNFITVQIGDEIETFKILKQN